MVQFSILTGGSLPVLESAVAGAARFAEAVRSVPNARAVSAHAGSVTVSVDRQHVAASGRISAEANARATGSRNATSAVSLLQAADDGLSEIAARLDTLATLADTASSDDLSDAERATLNVEFQSIKAEIDTIVEQTTFNGTALLQGGDGPGGALEISVKVGTGSDAADTITVTIAPASVADLSSDLDTGDITTEANAETAADSVEAAQDAVNAIRAGIAGDIQRFAAAARNNQEIEGGLGDAAAVLTSPAVAVDMAQLLATRIAEDSGFRLSDQTIDRIQKLLIGLEIPSARAEDPDTSSATSSAKSTDESPADSGVSGSYLIPTDEV